jgi:hypothetical protein
MVTGFTPINKLNGAHFVYMPPRMHRAVTVQTPVLRGLSACGLAHSHLVLAHSMPFPVRNSAQYPYGCRTGHARVCMWYPNLLLLCVYCLGIKSQAVSLPAR